MTDKPTTDLLGVRPLAEAARLVTKAAVDGASAFLSRICLPAAEEFGLALRDRVGAWRARNTVRITQRAEELLTARESEEAGHAPPRLVAGILESGSWVEDDQVQDLWAGLLASSCSPSGDDDSNVMFIDLLSRLAVSEARVLEYGAKNAVKSKSDAGWIQAEIITVPLSTLREITGISDFHRLDRELDHLRTVGLIDGGFPPDSTQATLTPTPLALQMYARCKGHVGNPLDFYGIAHEEPPEPGAVA